MQISVNPERAGRPFLLGLPYTTIADYIDRARRADLDWPLSEGMDDRELEQRLFVTAAPPSTRRPLSDWAEVHCELRRKGVTLQLSSPSHGSGVGVPIANDTVGEPLFHAYLTGKYTRNS